MSQRPPLYFVHPHVIARLESGAFVAKRQQGKAYRLKDRRNMLSPLNVTRRAIRYEPLVFLNRKETILEAVAALNAPEVRLLMVSGPSGRGKTAFTRGVLEMMGSGQEQVLWFDVSRHTDFDEVVRFLIEYMTLVCRSAQSGPPLPDTHNPIVTLERLLRMVRDIPILIVIDNIEFLVAPDKTLRSRELKEAFHFLLGFANVKMLFVGKAQPTADMNPDSAAVAAFQLEPLSATAALETLGALVPESLSQGLAPFVPVLGGEPAYLALFASLLAIHPDLTDWQSHLTTQGDAASGLIGVLMAHLSSEERLGLQVFAMVRHGVTSQAFEAILAQCEPMLCDRNLLTKDHARMHVGLKKVYPPQLVLQHLQHPEQHSGESIKPYYQVLELLQSHLVHEISEDTQARYHGALQGFYLAEKAKHVLQRVYPARTRHLVAEAQFHGSRVRRRKMAVLTQGSPVVGGSADKPYLDLPASTKREALPAGLDLPWPTFHSEDPKSYASKPVSKDLKGKDEFLPPTSSAFLKAESLPADAFRLGGEDVSPTVHLSEDDLLRLAELIALGTPEPTTRSALSLPASFVSEHAEAAVSQDELSAEVSREAIESSTPSPFQPDTLPDEEWALRETLEQAILTHNRGDIARSLMALGMHRLEKGRFSNGEACLQKALAYAQELTDAPLQVTLNMALGQACHSHYRHNQALSHYKQALALAQAQESTASGQDAMAQALLGLSRIYAFRQEDAKSLSLAQKALALPQLSLSLKAQCQLEVALHLDNLDRVSEAKAAYQKACLAFEAANDPVGQGQSLQYLAQLCMETEAFEEAIGVLTDALTLFQQHHADSDALATALQLSQAYFLNHDLHAARKVAQNAYQSARSWASPADLATVLFRLGQLAQAADDKVAARNFYQAALETGQAVLSEKSRERMTAHLNQLKENTP